MLFEAHRRGVLATRSIEEVRRFKREFFGFLQQKHPALVEALKVTQALTDQITARLTQAYAEFFKPEGVRPL